MITMIRTLAAITYVIGTAGLLYCAATADYVPATTTPANTHASEDPRPPIILEIDALCQDAVLCEDAPIDGAETVVCRPTGICGPIDGPAPEAP